MTDLPIYKSNVVSCEDPVTGTLRFIGDYSDFSVNKLFFIRLLKAEAHRLNLTQARMCFHKDDYHFTDNARLSRGRAPSEKARA